MTKKTRTFLTAFAGSIGIIGIALILAISSGSRAYIEKEQTKAVSNYPIQIEQKAMDLTALMGSVAAIQAEEQTEDENEDGKIYSDDRIVKSLTSVSTGMRENNLTAFKRYLEENKDKIAEYATDIQYSYAVTPNIFRVDPAVAADPSEPFQTNPPKAFEKIDEVNMGSSAGSRQYHFFCPKHTAAGPASSTDVPAERAAIPMETASSSQHSRRDSHSPSKSVTCRRKIAAGTRTCITHSATARPPASLSPIASSSPSPSSGDFRTGMVPSPLSASARSPRTGRIIGSARSPVCPRFPVLLYSEKISRV